MSQSLFYWKLLCNFKWITQLTKKLMSQSLFYWKLLCNSNKNINKNCFNQSQSLFYWKLLCNEKNCFNQFKAMSSQSLFYWKLLCNAKNIKTTEKLKDVTILILLETPLQFKMQDVRLDTQISHNPYFTGNSFAIVLEILKLLNK